MSSIIILGLLLLEANAVPSCKRGGTIHLEASMGAQAVSTSAIVQSKDLVFVGTVAKIYPAPADRSVRNWAVVAHIDKVVSGEFSGKTFSFAVHSPSKMGLRLGRTYTIKATWTDKGYVVDDTRWMTPMDARKTAKEH